MSEVWYNELAEAEIQRLRDDGVKVSDAQVVRIAMLAHRVEMPTHGGRLFDVPVPQVAGNATLWPLTLQASRWIDLLAERSWFGAGADVVAVAYAMAHGRHPGAFERLTSYAAAVSAVDAWASGVTATPDELSAAVTLLLTDLDYVPAAETDGGRTVDTDRMLVRLEIATGISRDVWATRTVSEAAVAIAEARAWSGEQIDLDKLESAEAMKSLLRYLAQVRRGEG